ncbi:ABC transporter permease [Haloimpatiens sp. FM7330]|uniref:ABC transporter permease n=1 Tax=Haloimpatiens sp. FM7330 TaxID=3298610 RepID=UPI003630BF95
MLRPNMTYWQDAWRRLKQNKVAIVSLILLIVIGVMTVIGPYLTKYSFEATNSSIINQTPTAQHWFGTDELGRDVFARVWKGGRVSMIIGILATLIEVVVGCIYGGVAGYFGGIVDDIMMRIIEVLVSIPYLIVVILISLIVGKGMGSIIIAMAITGWCYMARLVRGQLLQIKEQEYVLAAQTLGGSPSRIIAKHLIPNTLGIIIVEVTFAVPGYIFAEAFLSYLGLGVQSPDTSWGALASAAQQNLMFYPHELFFPSLMISLTMLSFNLLGDGLRDALDPKLRQ